MDWCRLSTAYYLDGAILRAGEPAEVLFLRCLAYSGAQETHGLVPLHVLPMLAPSRTKVRLDNLIRERLVALEGDHLRIRSWHRWQESLDVESGRRRRDRERKAAARAAERAAEKSTDRSADMSSHVRAPGPRKEVEVEVEKERSRPKTVSSSRCDDVPSDAFAEFWNIYPRRAGKLAAAKAFGRALKTVDDTSIIAGAVRFRDDPNRDPGYTPHAATWLNQGRWDDDPLPARGLRSVPSRVAEQDAILRGWHEQATTTSPRELGAG